MWAAAGRVGLITSFQGINPAFIFASARGLPLPPQRLRVLGVGSPPSFRGGVWWEEREGVAPPLGLGRLTGSGLQAGLERSGGGSAMPGAGLGRSGGGAWGLERAAGPASGSRGARSGA